MVRKQSFRALVFIALSLLGLLSVAILVKRTLELRKQAAYGTISLSLQPSPVSVCLNDQIYKIYLKLNPESFNVGAAELSFVFDESKAEITSVTFHSAYLASIYNQTSGRLNLTVLSTALEVPNSEVFDLAVIEVKGKSAGSFDLDLISYNIKGTRGSSDPTLDRDLDLANPDQVLIPVAVSVCGLGGGAIISFSPASQTVNPDQETTVNVDIVDITDLYGFQFDVRYQESVLDYVSWTKGDFMSQSGDANDPFWTSPNISDGLIGSIAVTRLNPDPPLSGSGTLLTITFRGGTGGNSPLTIENAKFLDRNGNQIPIVLSGGQIDIYRPGATATPTTRPTVTVQPTATTRPTATTGPSPTSGPSPTVPADSARLNFEIKLGGTGYEINGQPVVVSDIPVLGVKVLVRVDNYLKTFNGVPVVFDDQAIGRGSVVVPDLISGGKYLVLIKGPVHLARRFCENNQTGHCWLGEENITLHSGENYFNWTGAELEPGDINGDGVVDSIDFSQLKSAIGRQGPGIQQDLNFNKRVDTQDLVFFLDTLSNRYEDQL